MMLSWLKKLIGRAPKAAPKCQHDWLPLSPKERLCKFCSTRQSAPVPFERLKK